MDSKIYFLNNLFNVNLHAAKRSPKKVGRPDDILLGYFEVNSRKLFTSGTVTSAKTMGILQASLIKAILMM